MQAFKTSLIVAVLFTAVISALDIEQAEHALEKVDSLSGDSASPDLASAAARSYYGKVHGSRSGSKSRDLTSGKGYRYGKKHRLNKKHLWGKKHYYGSGWSKKHYGYGRYGRRHGKYYRRGKHYYRRHYRRWD